MSDGSLRVFGAPHRYVQGPGALDRLGPLAAGLFPRPGYGTDPVVARPGSGTETGAGGPEWRCVVLVDAGVAGLFGERLLDSCRSAGLATVLIEVSLEVTHANIGATLERVGGGRAVIVGVGGGKTLDLARAVSWRLGEPLVTVPTVASNDSPAAMAVAVYDDRHRMVEVVQTGRNPEIVLVDTAVIAGAPPRLLSAGIGDAVAKRFEARSCAAVGGRNQHGTLGLRTATAVADACYDTLRASAAAGLAAAARGEVDQALEDTVEATILMSGLAFENGGLSIAHSFVRGLQAVRGAREALHGEHVAYGLLVQLALEGEDRAGLEDLAGFLRSVSLPTTLPALGLPDPTDEDLAVILDRTLGSPHLHKTPASADATTLRAAVDLVESLTP